MDGTLIAKKYGLMNGNSGSTKKFTVKIVTKSTGDYDAAITVTQISGGIEIAKNDYSYGDLEQPVVIHDFIRLEYADLQYKYTLLSDSLDHEAGYNRSWAYNSEISIEESYNYT